MRFIASSTVGAGGAANITFTSIPGSFTDLVVLFSGRAQSSGGAIGASMRLNSDSGTNYTTIRVYRDGTSITNNNLTGLNQAQLMTLPAASATASTYGNARILIPNYATTLLKTIQVESVTENNASYNNVLMSISRWNSTATITSIQIFADSGNLEQYTTAYLYGVTRGSGGATVS